MLSIAYCNQCFIGSVNCVIKYQKNNDCEEGDGNDDADDDGGEDDVGQPCC